jgi:misacylated tRNA(Ala) deacylase
MTTQLIFREDAYTREASATVVAVTERGGIVLDRTLFYPTGGGQPGDAGSLVGEGGAALPIATTVWDDPAKTIAAHVPAAGAGPLPAVGEVVTMMLNWDIRFRRMRMHTGLHLLSVALPYPVTGGSIGEEESRLDFDIPDGGLDKDALTTRLNALVSSHAAVSERWITDAELDANPGLVKTMSVQPPRGSGRIRLVEIAGLDLQPCGGTHVRNTAEIGTLVVASIEKKGKLNRRVRVRLG